MKPTSTPSGGNGRASLTYMHSPYSRSSVSDPHEGVTGSSLLSERQLSGTAPTNGTPGPECSTPIRVMAAPNVQARSKRAPHTPTLRPTQSSGSYSATAVAHSYSQPYSPLVASGESSAFIGGESAPVRRHSFAPQHFPDSHGPAVGSAPSYPMSHQSPPVNYYGGGSPMHANRSGGADPGNHMHNLARQVSGGSQGGHGSYAPAAFVKPPSLPVNVDSSHPIACSPLSASYSGRDGAGSRSLTSRSIGQQSPLGYRSGSGISGSNFQMSGVFVGSHGSNYNTNGSPQSGARTGSSFVGRAGGGQQSHHAHDDAASSSSHSCSSASSVMDDLPLCPNDDACASINDNKHQRKYAHTCRLFPCYHAHIKRHAKLFRHTEGQMGQTEGMNTAKITTHALTSVNFSSISPEAPNAYRIYVSHGDKGYEIHGDWATVKVHTFKRYLHQVYHIAPQAQVLTVAKTHKEMDDEISTVKSYGIEEDSVLQLSTGAEPQEASHVNIDDL